MNYLYQKVHPLLSEYVRSVLVFDNETESSALPLFTNGMSALLCKANNHITLFGQTVPVEEWNETIAAFFFRPFSLATVFKIPAQNLKANPVPLDLWNAQKAMAVHIQLYHAPSTPEKVDVLARFICTQIEKNKRECAIIRYATDAIMHNANTDILAQLPEQLNVTERTFQRIFKKYVGITASEYRRICQHCFAFSHLKSGHFNKLADVAYANGYFDQSHYIRSFKEYTNTTPNEYLQSGLGRGN
ncbi:MAG: helix-turn-helix transcriptional regulator [Dinghuibacter sp.]|nr:helix-turn-helix transcriptional regulator [Dinghuibacter sp.]